MQPPVWTPPVDLSPIEQQIAKRIKRAKLFLFLRYHRHTLFDSAFQQELAAMYKDAPAGQPPIPPAQLALAAILQTYTGVSDDELIEATVMDRRWQLVLDCLDADSPPFSKPTLITFRQRLIETQLDRRLLERTIELAEATKAFGSRQLRAALSSSPLWGAGKVEDSYNLLGHAQNPAYYAARDMQTLGEPATGQAAVRALPASSRAVPRTVGVVILTAAVVIGGLYLLWQARQIIGWCVGGCVIAVALDPAVKWMQQYHLKRSTAILLVYGALLLVGLGLVALFLPPLVDQIQGLAAYGRDLASHPEREDAMVTDLASRFGLTPYLPRLTAWLHSLSGQLTMVAGEFLSYSAALINSVAAMISMLFIAFYLLLDGQRMISALFQFVPEVQWPRARRILGQSAGAVSGYITGNVTISVICGVAVFVVLVVLRMPYAGALALMVAVLDLIPQVGATLGGVTLVLAGLFISPFKSLMLLIYFIVYQQVENYLLQPLVYSHRVQLHPLTIFIAVVLGGVWLGVAGAFLAIPAAEIIRIVVAEWLASRAEQNHAVPAGTRHGSDVKIDQ